jgi:outer membrane lipoprotein-sorting protein
VRVAMNRRQVRWAVPAGAVAAVGLVIAGSVIAGAQAAPRLPARSSAQLLAAVDRPAALPSAMTAVVQETASLGLPDLPGSSGPMSALSLLSGTHTFKIWYNGPDQARVAIPVSLGETDLRLDGRNAWLWDSQTDQATHYLLPARPARPAQPARPATPVPPSGASTSTSTSSASFAGLSAGTPTPQQVAQQILAAVGQSTTVGTQQNVTVAGQPAYQLTLAPKDRRSLVGQVRIAIDARDSMPLRVQVFARGAASPAFDVGYTSLSFARPAASNFSFSPPPGAKVKTITLPAGSAVGPLGLLGLPAGAVGAGGPLSNAPVNSKVIVVNPSNGKVAGISGPQDLPPAVRRQMLASIMKHLPASLSPAQRAALLKRIEASLAQQGQGSQVPQSVALPAGSATYSSSGSSGSTVTGGSGSSGSIISFWSGSAPGAGSPVSSASSIGFPAAAPTVMGQGWLSVAVLPAGLGGPAQGIINALGNAATPVHGAWGSGRLLRTSLLSILLTSGGQVLIGAVQPAVLYSSISPRG